MTPKEWLEYWMNVDPKWENAGVKWFVGTEQKRKPCPVCGSREIRHNAGCPHPKQVRDPKFSTGAENN